MHDSELATAYRGYIACLNAQDWANLGTFVSENAYYNGQYIGLAGYQAMLENDFRQIPDLFFDIQLLVCDSAQVASRLGFECSPTGTFLGLPVNGKRVSFTENVFYEFHQGKIERVWSIIDKAAIEAQL